MPGPASNEEFLELIRRSGLLEDGLLEPHLDRLHRQEDFPTHPRGMADVLIRDGFLTIFQAEQFLLGKWRRFHIGNYFVLERYGATASASLYLCQHRPTRAMVVVKVLPTALAEDAAALERFWREVRVLAQLDHPNLIRAFDADQDGTLHFLVLEFVDGASLESVVRKCGPFEPARAAHYARQAALGLHQAHLQLIAHRDVSPANLLLARSGQIKVSNFAQARFLLEDAQVLMKRGHFIEAPADVYSLGASLYFCLAGQPPFPEGGDKEKLLWHQTRKPTPLRQLRPEIPEELVTVVEKMMAKVPEQRYQSAAAVAAALEPWRDWPSPPSAAEMPEWCPAVKRLIS